MSLASRTRRIVRQRNHNRLRAGIRAVVPTAVLMAAFVALSAALDGLRQPYGLAAAKVSQAALAVVLLAAWARYVDHRPVREYGFRVDRDWLLDLAGGALVAGGVVAGSVVTGVALGW